MRLWLQWRATRRIKMNKITSIKYWRSSWGKGADYYLDGKVGSNLWCVDVPQGGTRSVEIYVGQFQDACRWLFHRRFEHCRKQRWTAYIFFTQFENEYIYGKRNTCILCRMSVKWFLSIQYILNISDKISTNINVHFSKLYPVIIS